MHHARDPIPSCGGGVANLHYTVYAQNPESALPGARACEKEAGRRILYGGGFLSRCCLSATRFVWTRQVFLDMVNCHRHIFQHPFFHGLGKARNKVKLIRPKPDSRKPRRADIGMCRENYHAWH